MGAVAMFLAFFINQTIGAVWYSQLLFKDPWLARVGQVKIGKQTGAFVCCGFSQFVIVLLFNLAFSHFPDVSLMVALEFASVLCLLVLCLQVPHYVFCGRPWVLYFIDHGYDVVVIFCSSIITYLIKM